MAVVIDYAPVGAVAQMGQNAYQVSRQRLQQQSAPTQYAQPIAAPQSGPADGGGYTRIGGRAGPAGAVGGKAPEPLFDYELPQEGTDALTGKTAEMPGPTVKVTGSQKAMLDNARAVTGGDTHAFLQAAQTILKVPDSDIYTDPNGVAHDVKPAEAARFGQGDRRLAQQADNQDANRQQKQTIQDANLQQKQDLQDQRLQAQDRWRTVHQTNADRSFDLEINRYELAKKVAGGNATRQDIEALRKADEDFWKHKQVQSQAVIDEAKEQVIQARTNYLKMGSAKAPDAALQEAQAQILAAEDKVRKAFDADAAVAQQAAEAAKTRNALSATATTQPTAATQPGAAVEGTPTQAPAGSLIERPDGRYQAVSTANGVVWQRLTP